MIFFRISRTRTNSWKYAKMEIPCRVFPKEAFYLLTLSYSSSCNLTPPISLFLIGWHLIFCPSTWPRYCNSPRKCTLVKCKGRQKADCRIDNLLLDKNFLNSHKSAKVAGWCLHVAFFFLSEFSFTETDNSQDSREREGTIFYSTLPLPPAYEHSDIYLQLCMWDDYHIFLIAPLVFIRSLLDEIYHRTELPFDWLMMWS